MTFASRELSALDDLELLIREARARQRKRRLGTVALVAVLAGAALGIDSIVGGWGSSAAGGGKARGAVRSGAACGVRVRDMRIVDSGGRTLYREPGAWTRSYPHPSVVRCSGSSVWVVWDNGAAMNQEAYVGAHSSDGGLTWHLVFAEGYFGVDAPHELDSYLGPWALRGRAAYFTGWCPACGGMHTVSGTTSLAVTRDGGRSFRTFRKIPALIGYEPVGLRVSGRSVTISAKGFFSGSWRRKTVTIHAG